MPWWGWVLIGAAVIVVIAAALYIRAFRRICAQVDRETEKEMEVWAKSLMRN